MDSCRLKKILFVAASFFLFLLLQHQLPLWSSDEGRYGEIAREMWESRNFIIPHFNYVPFLDKPILAPVLTCFFYAIFGATDWATRLVPVTAALLGIGVLYQFAKKLFDKTTARFASVILLTTVGYVLVGRFAVIDMLMTFWISLSLFLMLAAFLEKKPNLYLAAYVCMGLGFLTKGLIGFVLPGGIFLVFLLWTKNLGELKRMKIPAGILIIAAIILPWLLAAMKANKEFFQEFIIEQHFQRFSTGTFGRKRPFWFFVPVLLLLGMPWTFFLPATIKQAFQKNAFSDADRVKIKFLICWILGILLFFSIPKSKLPYYILPATTPLALLIGNFFARIKDNPAQVPGFLLGGVWKLLALVMAAGAIGLNVYLNFFAYKPEILALKNFGLFVSLLLAAGFVSAFLVYRNKGLVNGVFALAATVYVGLVLTILGMKIISPIQSSLTEARIIESQLQPGDKVSVYASPDRFSDLPFHLRRRIIVAGTDRGTSTPQYDTLPEAERKTFFWEAYDLVLHFRQKEVRVFCLMEEERLAGMEAEGLTDYKVLSRNHGKILLANY